MRYEPVGRFRESEVLSGWRVAIQECGSRLGEDLYRPSSGTLSCWDSDVISSRTRPLWAVGRKRPGCRVEARYLVAE